MTEGMDSLTGCTTGRTVVNDKEISEVVFVIGRKERKAELLMAGV